MRTSLLFATLACGIAASGDGAVADVGAAGAADLRDPRDARHCIELGRDERSQTLRNRCAETAEVAWCHDAIPGETKRRPARCGSRQMYYQMHVSLAPGGIKSENSLTLPLGATLHYAACFGTKFTLRQEGSTGRYRCSEKTPRETTVFGKFADYIYNDVLGPLRLAERREYEERLARLFAECVKAGDRGADSCREFEALTPRIASGGVRD